MTDVELHIQGIKEASARRWLANEEHREATEDLHRWVKVAHEAKIPVTKIAKAARVSRQAIYDVLCDDD